MIDIGNASAKLVEHLRMEGSRNEADISMDRDDHYKPMYRAVALMVAPTHRFFQEVLGNERPTREQALAILRGAHPYFAHVLDTEPEWFDQMWEHHTSAWDWEGEQVE